MDGMNIYNYASSVYMNKSIIPQFCGYSNSSTWLLSESYSNWLLIFYKLRRKYVDEVKAS